MALWRRDPDPWPPRTWDPTPDGLLLTRTTVMVAGEDGSCVDLLRRCVHDDRVIVAGPLVPLEEAVDMVDELRPDVALLCGSTDDQRLHAAMYDLSGRSGPTRVSLLVRLGDTTRCLLLSDTDPATEDLVLRLTGEPGQPVRR